MALELTDAQKAKMQAAGIDWASLLLALKQFAPVVAQLILTVLDKLIPNPTPLMLGGEGCPDGKDGGTCCQEAQRHALLAALCCNSHSCVKGQCNTCACCQETLLHLLKAVDCCTAHLCCQDG